MIDVEGCIINESSLILCGLLINESYPETALNQIFDIIRMNLITLVITIGLFIATALAA